MFPNGIAGSYDFNFFNKSPTLNKEYIFNNMKGNPIYEMFEPDDEIPKNCQEIFFY